MDGNNPEIIDALGLDRAAVEHAVAAELLNVQGSAYAVSTGALRTNTLTDTFVV